MHGSVRFALRSCPENALRSGTVFLILLASLGLAACGKSSTPTSSTAVSVPQTAMALLRYTSSTGFGGMTSVALLRYTAGGVLDSSSFGTGGIVTTSATGPSTIASGNAVVVQPDCSIVVAGYD